ncbi:hypothetical protein E2C01_044200 [Portunus trituberculatus]|uniref:Uncharacterized protein n=1 Tax=Portunus trituberculatus TaxID=210409 RepID=A0A5B7FUZ1_PORTR|nr:hypothetical protein [Portunus trituberculatus]
MVTLGGGDGGDGGGDGLERAHSGGGPNTVVAYISLKEMISQVFKGVVYLMADYPSQIITTIMKTPLKTTTASTAPCHKHEITRHSAQDQEC